MVHETVGTESINKLLVTHTNTIEIVLWMRERVIMIKNYINIHLRFLYCILIAS